MGRQEHDFVLRPRREVWGVKVGGIRISHLSDIERDLGLSLNTTKGKKGEFVIKKLQMRSVSELHDLLTESAKRGTRDLRAMWKRFNTSERGLFGDECPSEFKQLAADVDASVPLNIASNDNQKEAA